jgi:phosphoribosylamine--glycine ligase
MREAGEPYIGFLYVSLMLTSDGPKVIEFNVRFGDPEAQVVLPRFEGPFGLLLLTAATGQLDEQAVTWSPDCCVGVVLASRGYPASSESGQVIAGLADAGRVPGALVFHAGTRPDGATVATAGGRVLTVVGRADGFADAMSAAYAAVDRIHFDGMQYRHDIGRKALELASPSSGQGRK